MKKPTYKRQKALLALLEIFDGKLSKLELQKYMFLYVKEFSADVHYDFIPYHYGSFSYELYKDLSTFEKNSLISSGEKMVDLLVGGFVGLISESEKNNLFTFYRKYKDLKGNDLIGHIYKKYPYFAINSKISERFIDGEELEKYRPKKSNQTLYTIGYEGKKFETYLNQLISEDIKALVDVRKNAHSMKYGFSKSHLKNAVEKLGIAYIHIPNLGIESENRQELHVLDDYQKLFASYEKTLDSKKEDLSRLFSIITDKKRVAITCFEKDVAYCHRGVIAKNMHNSYRVAVSHL